MNKQHGGKREGAGRKPRLSSRDEWMVTVSVRLPREMADKLRVVGEGNLSEGIRRALAAYKP